MQYESSVHHTNHLKINPENRREQGLTVWTEPRSSETGALEAGEAGFCSDVFEKRRNKHIHRLSKHKTTVLDLHVISKPMIRTQNC